MIRAICNFLYEHSDSHALMVAVVRTLVRDAGGAVVIRQDDLKANLAEHLDIRLNEHPPGVRIVVSTHGGLNAET